jgi:hypothetical protein
MNVHTRRDYIGGVAEIWQPHIFDVEVIEGLWGMLSDKG